MALEIIILAAGMGKRMNSSMPKVLHRLANKPLLFHVLECANNLNPQRIHLVLGHKAEQVREALTKLPKTLQDKISVCYQTEQLGTAHAVLQVVPALQADSKTIILYADTPLTPSSELERLLAALENHELALLTSEPACPTGYGRIVRNAHGTLIGIVEEKDATDEQKAIREVNTGMVACSAANLKQYLPQITNNNAQHEYYLTDLLGLIIAAKGAQSVELVKAERADILEGVNNKLQLANLERLYQKQKAEQYLMAGLTLADPERFDVRGDLSFGQDCFIDTNVIIEGKVILGNNVVIGTGCVLKDVDIGDNSVISPYTIMEHSVLKQGTTIGPFARLRPGNVLGESVHVGNFVEVKNCHIQAGTKAGHLTYLGDSDIGRDTNIGAGTITCNYDGANKHRTSIGNNVFVGSDTQLVAPVVVEDGATIAAGTTVTRTVMANALVLTRPKMEIRPDYQRPSKKPKV